MAFNIRFDRAVNLTPNVVSLFKSGERIARFDPSGRIAEIKNEVSDYHMLSGKFEIRDTTIDRIDNLPKFHLLVLTVGREVEMLPKYRKEPMEARVDSIYWDPVGFPDQGKTCDDPMYCRLKVSATFTDTENKPERFRGKLRVFWGHDARFVVEDGPKKYGGCL